MHRCVLATLAAIGCHHAPAATGGRDRDAESAASSSAGDLRPDEDRATSRLANGERIVRVATRDHVELPVIVVEPATPATAIVILYPGGGGRLALGDDRIGRGADNLVVRIRRRLAEAGFVALVVDAPSDQNSLDRFRISPAQAEDARALIRWATQRWPVPVWLVGTSRGTISAASLATRIDVAGLVLLSSVTAGDREKVTLHDVALAEITAPTLLVQHAQDGCNASPLVGAQQLVDQLTHASVVGWHILNGGDPPTGSRCGPRSPHGLSGLDPEVAALIVAFVHAQESR